MATVDTALSPREILNRLYSRLRSAYSKVLSAQPGDVNADRAIMVDIGAMDTLLLKLDYSFVRKLRDDAGIDTNSSEKMKEIERLLDEISRAKRTAIRQDHYIHKVARHMRNVVRGQAKKARGKGLKDLVKVKKKKEELFKKEKEAKEKAGKKS